MSLSSQLFQGDPALEAAANTDPGHIMRGVRGDYVKKIQTALNMLDNANLVVDGIYGQATANAVLKYKTKRDIVNRRYQASADDIVRKMTMARLDEELKAQEQPPTSERIKLIPLSPRPNVQKAYPRLGFQLVATNALVAVPANNILPQEAVTLNPMGTAEIEVHNGEGYGLTLGTATFEKYDCSGCCWTGFASSS
jgi:peptidoglycan hydrolase-like protein with peptidoglycan-binding domain